MRTEYFKHAVIISIIFSSKCRLFHNATLFGFCTTHILNTGVLKFEKKKSVAKRLKHSGMNVIKILIAI